VSLLVADILIGIVEHAFASPHHSLSCFERARNCFAVVCRISCLYALLFSLHLRFSLGCGQTDPKRSGEAKAGSALPIDGARETRRGNHLNQRPGDRDGCHANQVGGHTCVRTRPQGEVSRIAAREIDMVRLGEAATISLVKLFFHVWFSCCFIGGNL